MLRWWTVSRCWAPISAGKHLFIEFPGRPVHPRPPRPDRQVRRTPCPRPATRRPGTAAPAERARRTPTSAAPPPATWSTGEKQTAVLARLGPDPLRPDADPTGLGPHPPQPTADRRPADRPDGPRRSRQRLPGRGPVPAPDRPLRPGKDAAASASSGYVEGPRRAHARGRPDRPHRHRPPRAHAGGDGPPAARRRPRRRGLRLPPYRQPCLVCGARSAPQALAGRNLFWCPHCQPTFRSRAVG